MTLLTIGAAALAVLALAAAFLPRGVRGRAVAVLLVATAVVLGAAGVVDGWRWQLGLVAAGAVLVAVVAFARTRTAREGRRGLRLAGGILVAVLGVAALGAGGAASWALPPLHLPAPTGSHAVGTTTLQWTDDRPEPNTPNETDRRTLVARLWYPTDEDRQGRTSAYLGRDAAESRIVADALAGSFGLPAFLLDDAARGVVPAATDAVIADGDWPVVVFSHGLGGMRSQNTALAMDLASHGFVVLALDHPYDAVTTVLDDGTVIPAGLSNGPHGAETAVLDWVALRAADIRSGLDELTRLDDTGPFHGHLDTARALAAGHSLGGAASIMAATDDERFAAAVDIDGYPWGSAAGTPRPPILAFTSANGALPADSEAEFRAALQAVVADSSDGIIATVPGAVHLTFTDAPSFLPPLPSLVGRLGRDGSSLPEGAAIRVFADAVFQGSPVDRSALHEALGENVALSR